MTTLAVMPQQLGRMGALGGGIAMAGCLVVGHSMASSSLSRVAVGLSIALALIGIAALAPRLALYALVVWLALLGFTRRFLTSIDSNVGTLGDPLLLVGPVLLVVLFAMAVERGALRNRTRLSGAVLGLTVVLAASALNPLQGDIAVGLGGLLLMVVPMLSFWVGRSLLDERAVTMLVHLLAGLAVLAAVYGLLQTFRGMPAWDQAWIAAEGYESLNVGGAVRPFGTSSSASEYAALVGIGLLSWWALACDRTRWLLVPPALLLLAGAMWLTSVRGAVVLTFVALWLTVAAARRMRMGHALAIGAMLLLLLPTAVGHLISSPRGTSAVASLASHQVAGLSEPFGENSTLGIHLELVADGIAQTAANPLGRGLGATSNAAERFGGVTAGAEADPGNAPVAAGLIGLGLYLLVAFYGLTYCYRFACLRRGTAAVAALGIVVASFLQWLNGGQYVIILLAWLMLGWVDGERSHRTRGVG